MREAMGPRVIAAGDLGRTAPRGKSSASSSSLIPGQDATDNTATSHNSTDPRTHEHEPKTKYSDDTTLQDLVKHDGPLFGEDVDAVLASDDDTNLFDLLQQLGVDVVSACRFVNRRKKTPASVMELFGRRSSRQPPMGLGVP